MKDFEIEAVNLIRSWGIHVENIGRFTDTCSQQFRSRNTNADLRSLQSALGVNMITWHYFEANEGKNLSDSIGALTKSAFTRGVKKLDCGVGGIDDIISIIKSELRTVTDKFAHFHIQKFGHCKVPSKQEVEEKAEPLEGISTMHSSLIPMVL